jgi:hypothetical protein
MKRIGLIIGLMLAAVAAHATVTSQTTSVSFTCTGSTGPYPFTFSASAPAALTVTENGTLLSPTLYTVTAVNNNLDNGGSVTLNSACASGTLVLTRVTPLTQTSVFTDNMPVPMKTFENGLDKLTEIDQELLGDIAPLYTPQSPNLIFAGPASGSSAPPTFRPLVPADIPFTLVNLGVSTGTGSSQINVMAPPFNAKGDCVTDDSAAIQAALNVQLTSTPQITVYFPAPPGGCYLTSTLTVTGASMQGQIGAGASGAIGAGVVIKGKPGEDILHEPDPNTANSVNPRAGWSIRDIVFQVDGTVDVSNTLGAHRWPGKWTNDGSINASSYTFTSPDQEITCGDIGENILVKGAGAGGADLSTTIANVFPCWANYGSGGVTVTLTAAAGTSVTNAYSYITPAHIPVTQHIGNCALAADNFDGNPAHWVISGGVGSLEPSLWNVTITMYGTVPNVRNNTCGIYFGAAWNPYMLDAKNLWLVNTAYGIVEGTPDTNPMMGGVGNDFQKFDHGWWTGNIYPWISYNNGEMMMDDIQIAVAYGIAAASGPQVLQVGSASEYLPSSWYIHVPEMEYVENEAWRIEGGSATVVSTELCDGQTGTIDTIDSRFINSNCGGGLRLNGSGNWLDGAGGSNGNIVNQGMDNIYVGSGSAGSTGMRVTTPQTSTLNRGQQAWGTLTPDFVRNGTAPYYSDHDLFIWPQDFTDAFGVIYNVIADSNSWTGNYVDIPSGGNFNYFNNMYMLGRTGSSSPANQIVAGSNIPAGPVVVEFSYKCPSITSFLVNIKANGTTVGAVTPSCTTSYQTATVSADFTGYSGDAFGFALGAGEVDIAWMAVEPIGTVLGNVLTFGVGGGTIDYGNTASGFTINDPNGYNMNFTTAGNFIVKSNLTVKSTTASFASSLTVGGELAAQGGVVLNGSTPAAAVGDVGLGNTVTAASNCGSLAGATGCLEINVGGTTHYIPYY